MNEPHETMDCRECGEKVWAHASGLCMRCGKRPFPKLDATVKPNEVVVDLYDGLINDVLFGEGVPGGIVLKIVETDTNGLGSIEEDRILDNDGEECFVREYQDTEKVATPLDEAVALLAHVRGTLDDYLNGMEGRADLEKLQTEIRQYLRGIGEDDREGQDDV